jgi:glycogen operon protein
MKEADWKLPEGRFLAHVLGSLKQGQRPIFIVLNAAPEEIPFKLPKMVEFKSWRQVLNTTETKQIAFDFATGADTKVPPRWVLAFVGRT